MDPPAVWHLVPRGLHKPLVHRVGCRFPLELGREPIWIDYLEAAVVGTLQSVGVERVAHVERLAVLVDDGHRNSRTEHTLVVGQLHARVVDLHLLGLLLQCRKQILVWVAVTAHVRIFMIGKREFVAAGDRVLGGDLARQMYHWVLRKDRAGTPPDVRVVAIVRPHCFVDHVAQLRRHRNGGLVLGTRLRLLAHGFVEGVLLCCDCPAPLVVGHDLVLHVEDGTLENLARLLRDGLLIHRECAQHFLRLGEIVI